MSVVIQELRRREVGAPVPGYSYTQLKSIAQKARQELARAIRSFWESPEGMQLREALSEAAYMTGYAQEVQAIMESIAPQLKDAAKRTGIAQAYRSVWGKPA